MTFSQAVVAGLAPDGGLFVPCGDVRFGENELAEMAGLDYCGLAKLTQKDPFSIGKSA